MNWTSFKFIAGFVIILIISLSILIYFSGKTDIEESVDIANDIMEKQA